MQSLVITGFIGGLIATVIMTVLMMAVGGDDPPPTALFWSKYVGSEGPDAYLAPGMVLHFLYGIGAGGVFGAFVYVGDVGIGDLTAGILVGLGYGVVLFVIAAVFWMRIVLQLDANARMAAMFLVFHLVYGAVLGAWLGVDFFAI